MKKKIICSLICFFIFFQLVFSQNFISEKKGPNRFLLTSANQPVSIFVDSTDDWLVRKAATLLQTDLETVTGKKLGEFSPTTAPTKTAIIIGSLQSALIKEL